MFPLVYFVRHGETDWNAELRFQGQADIDINVRGRGQARDNGRTLAGLIAEPARFDFVASPLRRTRETMELIRAGMALDPRAYRTDVRLLEVHFGDWQGFTAAEIEARTPGSTAERERDKWDFLPPGENAESYAVLARRVRSWLAELTGETVCVTHGGVIRCIFMLTGAAGRDEAAAMTVPQDRVLRLDQDRLEWL